MVVYNSRLVDCASSSLTDHNEIVVSRSETSVYASAVRTSHFVACHANCLRWMEPKASAYHVWLRSGVTTNIPTASAASHRHDHRVQQLFLFEEHAFKVPTTDCINTYTSSEINSHSGNPSTNGSRDSLHTVVRATKSCRRSLSHAGAKQSSILLLAFDFQSWSRKDSSAVTFQPRPCSDILTWLPCLRCSIPMYTLSETHFLCRYRAQFHIIMLSC